MIQHSNTSETLTNQLLQAVLHAGEDEKRAALRALQGVSEADQASTRVEPYLTLREVSKQLNISPVSLWRWEIPGHILAGRRRFRMSEVQAYLESEAFRNKAEALREQRRAAVLKNNVRKGTTKNE